MGKAYVYIKIRVPPPLPSRLVTDGLYIIAFVKGSIQSTNTVKSALNGHSHKNQKNVSKTDYQREHSAKSSTFIKLPVVIKTFVLFCLFLSGRFTQVLL